MRPVHGCIGHAIERHRSERRYAAGEQRAEVGADQFGPSGQHDDDRLAGLQSVGDEPTSRTARLSPEFSRGIAPFSALAVQNEETFEVGVVLCQCSQGARQGPAALNGPDIYG